MASTTRSLLADRATLADELRSIHAASPDGALSETAEARFAVLRASLEALDSRIQRQALLDDLDRRAQAPVAGSGDNRFDAEVRNFSIVRAIAGAAGLAVDNGREKEISAEIARRSGRSFQGIAVPMAALSGPVENRVFTGASTATIGTDLRPDLFISKLFASMAVRSLGATVLSGLVGNVAIPKLTATSTSAWIADNAALTASDPTTAQVTLAPKIVGSLTEYSRLMLLQSSPDIETMLRDSMSIVIAQAVDTAAINGLGSSNQPRGVLQTSGIGSVGIGTNGGALALDNVSDLIATVANANAETGRLALLTNTKVKAAASKLKDSQNRPFGLPLVFQGLPVAYSNNVPSNLTKGTGTNLSALLYGNWADLLIGFWSEIDILVNAFESTAFAKGNVQVRVMATVDVAVRHAESFASIQDIVA